MDVTKPLPNERPALGDSGQLTGADIGNMGMDAGAEAFMNKTSYSESDFSVEPVVSGQIAAGATSLARGLAIGAFEDESLD